MVRRLGCVFLIGLLAACGWIAAPALSLDPYIPAAEDFSGPLPDVDRVRGLTEETPLSGTDHAHDDEGPITHVSEPIRAPRQFDLVGLAGELRPLELRAREAGGEWSAWVEAADGNPVYFGGADEVQLRTRGWRPSGHLHYVNVSGTSTAAAALLHGARRTLNAAFVSVASVVQPDADASAPRPDLITRRQWGANRSNGGCKPRTEPLYGKIKAGVVHHTVTGNSYSRAEAPAIVLGICRYHRNANGWNDIGYNALTDRFGRTYVGRAGGIGRAVVGAHSQGFNAQTTGMAVIGTHTDRPIGEQAQDAFARFLAWKLRRGKPITSRVRLRSEGGPVSRYPSGREIRVRRVIGHRRVNITACPGDTGRRQVSRIRELAHEIRTTNEGQPGEAAARLPSRLEIERARVRAGHLIVAGSLDQAVAGEQLAVRFRAAGTEIVVRPTVRADGSFSIRQALHGPQRDALTGRVIVRFSGTAAVRPVVQRVRAAQRAVWLRLRRTRIRDRLLVTAGQVARRAGRQVRVQIRFNRRNGSPAQIVAHAVVDRRGRFRLRRRVPPAVRDSGAWVAVTHPGRARLHGQRFGARVGS